MSEQQEKGITEPTALISTSEESSTERLQAELTQISAQLDTYAFRQDNKRISAFLHSEEGKQLSQQAKQHLQERIIGNTMNAVNADPEIERLFLREHELEIILWKRRDSELYAVDSTGHRLSTHRQDPKRP